MKIPKKMHCIWVWPNPAPMKWIQSRIDKHPDWEYYLWGNDDLSNFGWINAEAIRFYYAHGFYNGVADVMRYEILYKMWWAMHGADSLCLNPITELFEDGYENYVVDTSHKEGHKLAEENRYAAAPLYACVPGSPLAKELIDRIYRDKEMRHPVDSTGNRLMQRELSTTKHKYKRRPQHLFLPEHFNWWKYTGKDKVYAKHYWGSTRGTYNQWV